MNGPGVSLRFLRRAVSLVAGTGLKPLVFGGWAEELHGVRPAGPHGDIDLLVVDADPLRLDELLLRRGEIPEKRVSHKRAFLLEDALVELFLAEQVDGAYFSHFWEVLSWQWPPLEPVQIRGLPVAPREALDSYRSSYAEIHSHRPPQ